MDIGGSYNAVVDSFNWSQISIRYRTNLMENINISGGMSFDPYATNKATGGRSRTTYLKSNGKLMQFKSLEIAIRASLPVRKSNTALTKANNEQLDAIGRQYGMYADFNIPWKLELNYSAGLRKDFLVASQKDTIQFTQNLLARGEVNLTEKWRIGLSSGYDFRLKELSYTSFDIYRDLHCWEMKLNLIPFGPRKSYNFGLNVKSAVLQDLKLVRRKDFRDNL
jgi:hypothetical protein